MTKKLIYVFHLMQALNLIISKMLIIKCETIQTIWLLIDKFILCYINILLNILAEIKNRTQFDLYLLKTKQKDGC